MEERAVQPKTIRAWLVKAMKEGEFAHSDRLPPEKVLAEHLGISRTQLRDVLAGLEREGFITRRHGVGTIINHHVLDVTNRMDIECEFMDMIRRSGYEPGTAFVQAKEGVATATEAKQLGIEEQAPVLRVERICTADDKPVIYCVDILAVSLIKKKYQAEELEQPIFYFLQQYCDAVPFMDLTDIRAMVADEALAQVLQVEEGTPILRMDEVDYDVEGNPIICSREHFVDGVFRHTVMRKKL